MVSAGMTMISAGMTIASVILRRPKADERI